MTGVAKKWRVWTGSHYEETWAVSAAKAISNVVWRMRRAGAFPVKAMFTAEVVNA